MLCRAIGVRGEAPFDGDRSGGAGGLGDAFEPGFFSDHAARADFASALA